MIDFLQLLCGWALLIDVVLILTSIVPRLRFYTGQAIAYSSFLFGLTTWCLGVAVTWALWGGLAVLVGLFFFGVGPVFMALLALMFRGMWAEMGALALWLVLTIGSRLIGAAIMASAPEDLVETVGV